MKRFIALLCTVMLVVPVFVNAVDTPATETTTETTEKAEVKKVIRLSGDDRYETAVEVSKEIHESFAKVAIVAQGEVYADALGASSLTGKEEAPILLVKKDSVPEATANELKRLKAEKIIIIGGKNTVNEDVEQELAKFAEDIVRIQGKDRYETAIKIAEEMEDVENIFMVNGRDFPDALSAGAPAAVKGYPIIYSNEGLPAVSKAYIDQVDPGKVIVVGGLNSVPLQAIRDVKSSDRYHGIDREATSLDVAKNEFSNPKSVIIADGKKFPDALVGSALAANVEAPILLVHEELTEEVVKYLEDNTHLREVYVLGGIGSVSEAVFNQLEKIIADKKSDAPKISVENKEITVVQTEKDEEFDVWNGVQVEDDVDSVEMLKLSTEPKDFKPITPGIHPVTLIAEDTDGNSTRLKVTFRVLEKEGINVRDTLTVQNAKKEILTQLNLDRIGIAKVKPAEASYAWASKLDDKARDLAEEWAATGTKPTGSNIATYTGFRTTTRMLSDFKESNEYKTILMVPSTDPKDSASTVVYGIGVAKNATTGDYFWVVIASNRFEENNYLLTGKKTINDAKFEFISEKPFYEIEVGKESDYTNPRHDLTVKETFHGNTIDVTDSLRNPEILKNGVKVSSISTEKEAVYTINYQVEGRFGQIGTYSRTLLVKKAEGIPEDPTPADPEEETPEI